MIAIAAAAALTAFALLGGRDEARSLVPRTAASDVDPLAYDDSQGDELEERAIFGLSQPLYAKSPGGVFAAARRTESFRSLIENAVNQTEFDADLLEAVVFLESGGRPDVIAGNDPVNASGLTQILAETAENFLGMAVDLDLSRALTAQIAGAVRRGNLGRAERLRERRRVADSRF